MKRSAQVGLVLMSAATAGGGAYMLMPGQDCRPETGEPALHAPLRTGETSPPACAPRGSSGSSGGTRWSSGSWWGGSSGDSGHASGGSTTAAGHAGSTSHAAGTSVAARGGFGSIGHAFSSGG
ncbi:hypothetical protein RHODGE_RHODGE_04224 [Rhodoplanes serenus]|uniref:Uncharacterized protein n=1 Tax=Rhodoplanes serenus TaxID=200615 RepID=A0A447D0D6_9BRAD|nr:hypothetical protein [Rhodoplanes serenus]VCU11020.1 hypothetical protein RHODGE_RHODGE_04224 [Rhodoplanes serenus]